MKYEVVSRGWPAQELDGLCQHIPRLVHVGNEET